VGQELVEIVKGGRKRKHGKEGSAAQYGGQQQYDREADAGMPVADADAHDGAGERPEHHRAQGADVEQGQFCAQQVGEIKDERDREGEEDVAALLSGLLLDEVVVRHSVALALAGSPRAAAIFAATASGVKVFVSMRKCACS